MNKFALTICLFSMVLSSQTFAWGQNGHRIVGGIAQSHLTIKAAAELQIIMGRKSLAQLSTWPDEIRSDHHFDHTHPWHYISINDNESLISDFPRSEKGDILWALEHFKPRIIDSSLSQQQRWEALAFFVHFVGDIHQPLHVGNRIDRGGNDVKVTFFSKPSNLHRVWDSEMIDSKKLSYTEYTQFIDQVSKPQSMRWAGADFLTWAEESKLLRKHVYQLDKNRDGTGYYVGYQYIYRNTPIFEQRLNQAGIRLAAQLNALWP